MTEDTMTIEHTVEPGGDYGNGKAVKLVGKAGGRNGSALVPVQFEDGTYGVVWDNKDFRAALVSRNPEWNEVLEKSDTMPTADYGVGSDVLHILVTEGGKKVLLKHYFNEKASYRTDGIHRD